MRRAFTAVLLTSGLIPGSLLAHEGHKVMGTVTAVDVNRLEVRAKDGKTVSIALTPETKYVKSGTAGGSKAHAASSADLKVGLRVIVAVTEEGETMTATEVTLGGPGKPHTHDEPHQH
jgi:hypothetical protein